MDQSESLGTHHLQYVLGKPVHGRTLCSAADMKTTRPGWLLPVLGTIPSMESGGRHSIAWPSTVVGGIRGNCQSFFTCRYKSEQRFKCLVLFISHSEI